MKSSVRYQIRQTNYQVQYKRINSTIGYIAVAIGNPERHMRKASHCGSKQH